MKCLRHWMMIAALLAPLISLGQSLQLEVDSRDLYAGLPFVLSATARGFEEEPSPAPPPLEIDGCRVTYLGVSPNVSSRIMIVNGRRSESREVTFVYRWRVEASAVGAYTVPSLTLTQGQRSASSGAADFSVREIASSNDMAVRLTLPERPVWVGETFDIGIEWLLRREVRDHQFVVPLFDIEGVEIEAGDAGSARRSLAFPAGDREIALPMTQDTVTERGTRYNRLRFPARVTVTRPGPLEIAPVRVAARLETGTQRDSFGFRVPGYELFKAEGSRQRLVVRPLPQEGRPESFENAIGSAFSIAVQASRTVVQVGDPVDLQIRVRGDGPLEGLSLPRLDGAGGLPPTLFGVPDSTTVGVIDAEDNAKTFDVTVRVRSAEAREIPPIAFSYFDPQLGEYATVRSQPVALSVAGSSLVGAADVTAAPTVVRADSATETPAGSNALASLIGADMSLSAASATTRSRHTVADLMPILAALYLVPLLIFGWRTWRSRTRGQRSHERARTQALATIEQALNTDKPLRECAPGVLAAVRALARLTGREDLLAMPVLQELETQAYDPARAERPIDAGTSAAIRALAAQCASTANAGDRAGTGAAMAGLVLAGIVFLSGWPPGTQAQGSTAFDQAREAYQSALRNDDRVQRIREFAEAERQFRDLAAANPGAPDLLSDWGNAALGAQDRGAAVLAYRRALDIAPTYERARTNLQWLRDLGPVWLPRPAQRGALDSLFFWHHDLSVAQRHLIGAIAFALGVLLLTPWGGPRTGLLRRLAVPALLVWLAATGSALIGGDGTSDAVVMSDGSVLRSADSLGAPPALANALPAGTELRVLEQREAWVRVALADGTRGWVASSAVERVAP